jgi:hypothetical protein
MTKPHGDRIGTASPEKELLTRLGQKERQQTMRRSIRRRLGTGLAAAVIAGGLAVPAAQGAAPSRSHHVLLISVDGLHDFDLNLWVAQHPKSNLAGLVHQGTTYSQASTSIPSDSFPGLLAMLTGGTPKSTGVFYDVSYDRSLYPPGSACQGPQGSPAIFDESIAKPDAAGNIPFWGSIDPSLLPLRKVDDRCDPVQPRDFLKVNTIFGVAHAAGLRTAWSDKHPAYQIVEGPGTAKTVDDLFTPEINASVTPSNFPRPDLAIPDWVSNTVFYDNIKVAAVRNQIDGLDSTGKFKVGVPAIFGMNFQTVSVGEKLVDPVRSCVRNTTGGCDPRYVPGGYLKTKTGLAFTPQMASSLAAVDNAVGRLVSELHRKGLWSSTEVILSAKHGQSPIDPTTLKRVDEATLQAAAGADSDGDDGLAFDIADSGALLWLKDGADRQEAVNSLRAHAAALNIGPAGLLTDGPLHDLYGANERTPDIIVQPVPGTMFSTSVKKVAEHGGGSEADTHVALVVAGGGAAHGVTVGSPVQTRQIAPSILTFLGLNPGALQAVAIEGTTPLPVR